MIGAVQGRAGRPATGRMPGVTLPAGNPALEPAVTARAGGSIDPVSWMAETIRGCAGGLGEGPRLEPDEARVLAAAAWSELLRQDENVFPVQAERLGVRFYLHEERGSHRLAALAWDGIQWRTVGNLRLPATD